MQHRQSSPAQHCPFPYPHSFVTAPLLKFRKELQGKTAYFNVKTIRGPNITLSLTSPSINNFKYNHCACWCPFQKCLANCKHCSLQHKETFGSIISFRAIQRDHWSFTGGNFRAWCSKGHSDTESPPNFYSPVKL